MWTTARVQWYSACTTLSLSGSRFQVPDHADIDCNTRGMLYDGQFVQQSLIMSSGEQIWNSKHLASLDYVDYCQTSSGLVSSKPSIQVLGQCECKSLFSVLCSCIFQSSKDRIQSMSCKYQCYNLILILNVWMNIYALQI